MPRRRCLVLSAVSLLVLLIADGARLTAVHAQPRRTSRIRAEQPKVSIPTVKPPAWDAATIDIFFADARKHLGPGGPRAEQPTTTPAAPGKPDTAVANPVAGDAPKWSKLVSPDTLEDEIKQLLIAINDDVASPGSFKSGGFQSARLHLTLLAALFDIIGQYDGDVRWKPNAAAWAELFGRAGQNCKAGSDASYKEAKLRAADLAELIRGADAEPAGASGQAAADRIDRRPLMARLERSQQERVGPWTASAAAYGRHRDELKHEAELLSAIAEVIQRTGYEFAEDEVYRDYARQLQAAAIGLGAATAADDYPQARAASSAANQSCEKCHADYRG